MLHPAVGRGQSAALIMISTHAGADYADLIAESPAVGFVPKAELSAAAIRQVLGTDSPGLCARAVYPEPASRRAPCQ